MKFIRFVSEFLKHPKQVGAVAESSPFLARKMVRQIGGATDIVEFGPGTGAVTKEILRHLPENGKLTCFEINPSFCEQLKAIKDPRLKVINDDVKNCGRYVDNLDCIVSSLPLAAFDESEKEEVLALSSKSRTYIQFQYNPFLKSKLKRYFRDVKIKFVPLNIPPAFVYVSKNPRHKAIRSEYRSQRKAQRDIFSRQVTRTTLRVSLVYANLLALISKILKA
ncbi:MAG: methyltransferase domain-containing protein [Phycisphaerae bacterium]|nr:methyltransferase domain-containing protein [Phycisphaerae bacterium]